MASSFVSDLLQRFNRLDTRRLLTACFMLALTLRLLLIAMAAPLDGSGQFEHGEIARNLVQGHGFAMHWPYEPIDPARQALKNAPPTHETAFLPPLNPWLLAGTIAVFGDSPAANLLVLLFYALVSCCQVLLAYGICRYFASESTARLAALIAAVFVPAATAVASFSGSALYQTLALTVLWLCLRLNRRADISTALFSGLALGLLILLRAEFIAFGPVLLLLSLWPRLRTQRMVVVKLLAVAALPVVVLVGPWLLRNYQLYDKPVGMSSHPWNEIWRGTNPYASGSSYDAEGNSVWVGHGPWTDIAARLDSLPYNARFELAADSLQREIVMDFISREPAHAASLFAAKFAMIWTFDWYAPKARNPVYLLFSFAMTILFILGMNVLRRNRQWLPFLLFLAFVLAYTALFTLTHVEPRYRIYMMSCMTPVAALGLNTLLARLTKPKP